MSFALQAFKTDTLASDITDSATSMTLTTGAYGTPSGEQMLVIDYDIAAKREIVKCAIDGTAVTSIDRAQDGTSAVAHSSGAKIIMAFVPSHYSGLVDGTSWADNAVLTRHITDANITQAKLDANLKAGWSLLGNGTRTAATTFTMTGDQTAIIAVGDKLKYTDTTTKYGYVTAVAYTSVTTVTVTGGSEYALVGNPTNIYYSKASSPVGFPFGPSWQFPAWVAATLQNSWVNYSSTHAEASFMKDNLGFVHLQGLIKSGTATNGTVIFVLPAGYRPAKTLTIPIRSASGATLLPSIIDIENNGNISVSNAASTYLTISGVTFKAEA